MPKMYNQSTARASAVLPNAGAYDSSPTFISLDPFDAFYFLVTYTRGGAGGSTAYEIEVSNDGSTWFQIAYVQASAVTTGADVQQLTQKVEILYGSTSASAERFTTTTLEAFARFVRIAFKEVGATGTPGTVACTFVGVTSY